MIKCSWAKSHFLRHWGRGPNSTPNMFLSWMRDGMVVQQPSSNSLNLVPYYLQTRDSWCNFKLPYVSRVVCLIHNGILKSSSDQELGFPNFRSISFAKISFRKRKCERNFDYIFCSQKFSTISFR